MTAKSLQTPKIIEVIGSTIRVAHPVVNNVSTSLAAPIAVAGVTMSVFDNNGFADNDWFILGRQGASETEECDVNGTVTRGQSITVTNTLKFGHNLDTPVTKIYERGIKIYGAATDGGAGTLIASIDAVTTPIADAVMIQWDKKYTEYTLISTDTAYAYYYAVFTDGTTSSSASTYVPSTGLTYTKIETLVKQALDISNTKIDDRKLTREMFVNWANDCQDKISQFVYQDTNSGRLIQKDWSFEIVTDETVTVVEGEDIYSLSALLLKYPNSDKSIFSVQVGGDKPLKKWAMKDYDIERRNAHKTYADGGEAVGAITLTVDSTANFSDTGSLRIGSQSITYTGKTATTFTGIPASGVGSITAIIADNTAVWQNVNLGKPARYLIYNGSLYLDYPPSSTYEDDTIKVRYLKTLTRITSVSDGTVVPFTNVFVTYFVGMIYFRTSLTDLGMKWMQDFERQLRDNAQADYIPMLDEWTYYNFGDDIYDETYSDNEL